MAKTYTVPVNTYFSPTDVEILDEVCAKLGVTRAVLVRSLTKPRLLKQALAVLDEVCDSKSIG